MLESRPEAAAAGGDAMPQQHQRAPCHPRLVFGLSTSRAATLPERTKESRARVVSGGAIHLRKAAAAAVVYTSGAATVETSATAPALMP
jgi:hypothetical protein